MPVPLLLVVLQHTTCCVVVLRVVGIRGLEVTAESVALSSAWKIISSLTCLLVISRVLTSRCSLVFGTQTDDDRDHQILLQLVQLLQGGIVDDRLEKCPFRTWRTRLAALHQETYRLQAVALLNRAADSEKVVSGARSQDGVQVESEPQHVVLLVRIRHLRVLLCNYRIRPSRPLDQNVRLRRGYARTGHQLRLVCGDGLAKQPDIPLQWAKVQGFTLLDSNEVDDAEGLVREQVGEEVTRGKRDINECRKMRDKIPFTVSQRGVPTLEECGSMYELGTVLCARK